MLGELTSTQTSDGLTLHGFLQKSNLQEHQRTDLILFVHGVGSNFYKSSLLRKTHRLFLERGISLLSVNTRGHDFVFSAGIGGQLSWCGSAFETISDSVLDLEAWARKARKLGFERILLAGHSLGAIKTLYSLAFGNCKEITAAIAISPSCLSAEYFGQSSRSEEYQHWLKWAEQEIRNGRDMRLEEVSFPFKLTMSPRTFYDKYGPEEKYNLLRFVDRVDVPLQLVFGELELASDNPAFSELDARLKPIIESESGIALKVVADADHYYSGVQSDLANQMIEWIDNR